MVISFATLWDANAQVAPGRTALVGEGRRLTWGAFAERADRLAWHLQAEIGLDPGDRVAIALPNRSEYLETFFAALKVGCVPMNLDVRYRANEFHDVLDHSDAKLVVHDARVDKAIGTAARRIPKRWRPQLLGVGEQYERGVAGAAPPGEWDHREARGDDLVLVYAGGAAGTTTAVMWRNEDLAGAVMSGAADRPDATVLPAAPLTHPLGLFPALEALLGGGAIVLADGNPFDPIAVWAAVAQERVDVLAVGSDGIATRLLAALDDTPDRWDLSGLRVITSAGEGLRETTRARLAARLPGVALPDPPAIASTVGEHLRVVDANGDAVEPGSGAVGRVAVGGAIPLGYFKDPERTAAEFRTIDGRRYSIRSGEVTVDLDGAVRRAHAGAFDIVTGGHAVSALAVEAKLLKHTSVVDCAVVGVPDALLGQRVVVVVQVVGGHFLDESELIVWCRTRLLAEETPRHVLFVDVLRRSADTVADRIAFREMAVEGLGQGPS